MSERRETLVVGVSGPESVGWAIARRLARRGDRVTITSRAHRREVVEPMARAAGLDWAELDIDRPDTIAALFDRYPGALDVLVHTLVQIPRGLDGPLIALERAEFERAMSAGAWSLIALCGHALPAMRRSDSPRVLALSSALAERVAPSYHALGITKAALEAAVRYLAMELGAAGIQCNAVRFSMIPTAGAQAAIGEGPSRALQERIARRAPTRAATGPDAVALAVEWLTGADATNLTGEILNIDGGFALLYA